MPEKSAGRSTVVIASSATRSELPPGLLLFSRLLEPDDAFGQKKFQVLMDYNKAEQQEALAKKLEERGRELWPGFLKDYAERDNMKLPTEELEFPDALPYVKERVTKPNKTSKLDTPYFTISAKYNQGVDKKTGKPWETRMLAWDRSGSVLDLHKLRLGRGSIVQPIVTVSLFCSKIQPQPCFSLRLHGVRVLKLVQWLGGGIGAAADEDVAIIGDQELDDDLSAFYNRKAETSDTQDREVDKEDDMPF